MRFDTKAGAFVARDFTLNFGIVEGIGAGLIAAGVGTETAGIIAPVLLGAGVGSATSAATGGDPGIGALTGAVTGGFGELGAPLGAALGIGEFGGDLLAGAAGGTVGSAIGGGDPAVGALTGAVGGGVKGISAQGAAGGAVNAVAGGAPATPDLTSTAGLSGAGGGGTSFGAGDAAAAAGGLGPTQFAGPGPDFSAPGTLDSTIGAASGGALSGGGGGGIGGSGGLGGGAGGGGTGLDPAGTFAGAGPISDLSTAAVGAGGKGPGALDTALDNPTWHNIGGAFKANAAPLVAGAGLLNDVLGGQQNPGGLDQLTSLANGLVGQGGALSSAINTGVLPAGAQAQLKQGSEAAKATIRSKYAQLGLSGSTMESQDLASVDQTVASQGVKIATDLLQTGVQETQLSAQIYDQILRANELQNQETTQAIGSFARALGGLGA